MGGRRRTSARAGVLAAGVLLALTVGTAAVAAPEGAGSVAPAALPREVPAGFVDTTVHRVAAPTSIEAFPDGRLAVLEQGGSVRIIRRDGRLRGRAALTIPTICTGGERGLLGMAIDPAFSDNGYVYLYFTRQAPRAPGGCVNRLSRFTMARHVIDWSSQRVLLDRISSVRGNHNGGDIEFGKDGFLYVAIGDAGSDPRGDSGISGENDAAQDRSLLNGKILRITSTGRPAPGNPFDGERAERCARRGNTPDTPRTPCREIFALGLRNPFRMAFDPDATRTRFFVNDVGQGTMEEVNRGVLGANYGWPLREGPCPQTDLPPCPGPPAGLTDPIEAYGRELGQSITAGAFVPAGSWPDDLEGGYLFADWASDTVWFRSADGVVDWDAPFVSGVGQIVHLTFVTVRGGDLVLWYTRTSGEVGRITVAG